MNNEELKQLDKQIDELEEQLEPLKEKRNKLYQQQADTVEKKIERVERGKDSFALDELRFAARSRCECGAGMAYPKNIGIWGSWYCSDILLGRAISKDKPNNKTHTEPLPFQFYEIKSEDQPSGGGRTTRPENQ